jgi:hypothetical protein
MPDEEQAAERVRLAEAHARKVAQVSSLAEERRREIEELHIAAELFPSIDIVQRAVLVAWKMRVGRRDETPTSIMKDCNEADFLAAQMKASGPIGTLDNVQNVILREWYDLTTWPG